MFNFKEGDTVVCSKSTRPWITQFGVYTIQKNDEDKLAVRDDEGTVWTLEYLTHTGHRFSIITGNVFRQETFDLNKLTTVQLREYVGLLEDKEESERLLNEFIERMSK